MTYLNVSCIQRFSTGDGDGIRTTVFLKGCNLRCPWCHNPENISKEPETLLYNNGNTKISYGKKLSAVDVVSDVIEDIEFYRASGGGVTISGGEPLLQSKAVSELNKALKDNGISTLIDTAGCVPWENFTDVIDSTDTFYFDYKTSDEELYKKVINGDKELIYENLKKLISFGSDVHVRIPLIPKFNMSENDCRLICSDLKNAGVKYVDLLPFHRLGGSKYEALGIEYAYKDILPPDTDTVKRIKDIYGNYFITIVE